MLNLNGSKNSKKMKKKNNRVVELSIPEHEFEFIEQMRMKTGIANKEKLVRQALNHYIWCLARKDDGYEFAIHKDEEAFSFEV